uniref:uncharacterized protein At4g00950 n=1 Tax=Erigeron canadensis TaxID=72917 RepID=UPI001CB8970E|nr:uncharacterized protein At4g00950 [Erigeron canadensis]
MTPTPSYYNPYIPLRSRLQYSPIMDYSPLPDFREPLSTPPKLSLFSLPSKPSTLPDGPTPPPNMVANVPFLWEEAPGKPRKTYVTTTGSTSAIDDDPTKSKVVRSLDLPPRLTATTASPANYKSGEKLVNNVRIQIVPSPTSTVLSKQPYEVNNVRIQIVPSPTTVLSGPYEGHLYPSNTLGTSVNSSNDSDNNKSIKGKMRMPLRKLMRKEKSAIVKFGSWRWQSFRDSTDHGGKVDRSPSSGRFCSWRWDSFADTFGGSSGSLGSSFRDLHKSVDSNGKITRKNSFPFAKGTTSGRFLASMFGTLKQAMPWRSRRQE